MFEEYLESFSKVFRSWSDRGPYRPSYQYQLPKEITRESLLFFDRRSPDKFQENLLKADAKVVQLVEGLFAIPTVYLLSIQGSNLQLFLDDGADPRDADERLLELLVNLFDIQGGFATEDDFTKVRTMWTIIGQYLASYTPYRLSI